MIFNTKAGGERKQTYFQGSLDFGNAEKGHLSDSHKGRVCLKNNLHNHFFFIFRATTEMFVNTFTSKWKNEYILLLLPLALIPKNDGKDT